MDFIEITPRLHMLHFSIGQAYLWRDDEELTLIDAGWVDSAPEIESAMRGAGLDPAALRRIVLTHCHRDHVGSAQALADRFGAEIVAHRLDAAVIRGEAPAPEPVLLDWEIPLYERGLTVPEAPATRVDREVEDGEALGFGDGAVVVHTPGHTPGSLAVHLPEHGVLFTGDTVATVQGVTFGVFHVDRERAMDSMRRLAELKPSVLCCGHGDPVTTDTARQLAEAAA
ncbi:MBL fold metallo-hydrolase [Streptomyces sp. NPDC059567]|uniref:MBL fold metallo-hydrolase n=1 Tax=Streptomyces sp. NPDC059567 TaxID=3346867 RepID=UPI0036D0D43F